MAVHAVEEYEVIPGQRDLEGGEVPVAPLDEIQVKGSTQLGLHSLGGKAPTSGTLTLTGTKLKLEHGQAFNKGDTVVLQIVAVVNDAGQKDQTDKATGIVMACEQYHKAYISDAQVIDHS